MDEAYLGKVVWYVFCLYSTVAVLLLTRYAQLARRSSHSSSSSSSTAQQQRREMPCRTLIVMGSGGHTSEMIRIVEGLNLKNYSPRIYISAKGDKMSPQKVQELEKRNKALGTPAVVLKTVPRARQVLQSYFTSVFTTLAAILSSATLVLSSRPDLLLCNGPGTCIPVCFWAYLLKFFALRDTRIIYVESWCRVQKLSLSGAILYYLHIADSIFVQWPRLKEVYPRTKYIGRVL